ncbi:MAG: HAD hydrolase-like protein, partial [Phocaeicola sp.]
MKMRINTKKVAFLFDMDGVIIDTEPLYEKFWNGIANKYHIKDPEFANRVKGRTISDIISQVLDKQSRSCIEKIIQELGVFEQE